MSYKNIEKSKYIYDSLSNFIINIKGRSLRSNEKFIALNQLDTLIYISQNNIEQSKSAIFSLYMLEIEYRHDVNCWKYIQNWCFLHHTDLICIRQSIVFRNIKLFPDGSIYYNPIIRNVNI